jgi:hypothetical protein
MNTNDRLAIICHRGTPQRATKRQWQRGDKAMLRYRGKSVFALVLSVEDGKARVKVAQYSEIAKVYVVGVLPKPVDVALLSTRANTIEGLDFE